LQCEYLASKSISVPC